jgi:hypothetical protein
MVNLQNFTTQIETMLVATVNKKREDKTNIVDCIICFGDLEESSSPRSEPEATFHSKKLKKACFCHKCMKCVHYMFA